MVHAGLASNQWNARLRIPAYRLILYGRLRSGTQHCHRVPDHPDILQYYWKCRGQCSDDQHANNHGGIGHHPIDSVNGADVMVSHS